MHQWYDHDLILYAVSIISVAGKKGNGKVVPVLNYVGTMP
jgi:hypothetical protein